MTMQASAGVRVQPAPEPRMRAVWAFAIVAILSALCYAWAVEAPYYMDDFGFFYGQSDNWLEFFEGRSGGAHAYRPLEGIILVSIQERFGFATWPIHALAIAGHALLGMLVFWTVRRLDGSDGEALLAAALFAAASGNVSAVMGNDTLSQVLSALFGCLGTYCLWRALAEESRRQYWLACACLGLGLLFKETAAGYLVVAGLLIVLFEWPRVVQMARLVAPLGILAAGFVALRHSARSLPAAGESGYSLQFHPVALAKKVAMLLAATFSPVSTVDVYRAAYYRHWATAAGAVVLSAALIGMAVWGLRRSRRLPLGALLFGLGCASLFPAVFLGQVSELYAYNGAPYFWTAAGLGLGGAWRALRTQRTGRWVAALGIALLLVVMFTATLRKTGLMLSNGRRAWVAVSAIAAKLKEAPSGGRIHLVNERVREPQYSVFLRSQFNLVEFGCRRMGRIFGRPDVMVDIVEASKLGAVVRPGDTVLRLREGCVVEGDRVLGCGI